MKAIAPWLVHSRCRTRVTESQRYRCQRFPFWPTSASRITRSLSWGQTRPLARVVLTKRPWPLLTDAAGAPDVLLCSPSLVLTKKISRDINKTRGGLLSLMSCLTCRASRPTRLQMISSHFESKLPTAPRRTGYFLRPHALHRANCPTPTQRREAEERAIGPPSSKASPLAKVKVSEPALRTISTTNSSCCTHGWGTGSVCVCILDGIRYIRSAACSVGFFY